MKQLINQILTSNIILGVALLLSFLCKKATDGFSELSIIHTLNEGVSPLPDSFKHLEHQTFSYLGKGAQSYVFLSEDKQYVIKFLRFDHLLPKLMIRFLHFIPHPYIQSRLQKSKRELNELLNSFSIAQNQLSEFTLVQHFQTQNLTQPLKFIDRIGVAHKIKNAPFILQLYAKPLNTVIDQLTLDEAKEIIKQVISLCHKRHELQIHDKDPNLLTNFGLHEHRLIEFDIGRFYPQNHPIDKTMKEKEIHTIIEVLWPKLLPKYPELQNYLSSCL